MAFAVTGTCRRALAAQHSPALAQCAAPDQPWSRGCCYLRERPHSSQPDLSLINPDGRGVTQIRDDTGRMQQQKFQLIEAIS